MAKNPGQRKRRQERESCINNVKLNLTSSKDYRRHNVRPIDDSTYTRRPRDKFQRCSLENVSSNPWGEHHLDEQSSLRRSRSLAITREDIFTNLDVQNSGRHNPRRAQLIPRAKLIERNRDQRYFARDASAENLYGADRTIIKRKSSLTPPDYSPSLENSTRNRPSRQATDNPPINNLAEPKFIIGTEPDNSDSNHYNGTSINAAGRISYEDLAGLSLPNYYPDSKYDTDNTDISVTDNISSESYDNSKKYSSCDNISAGKWTINESESISYDDNIVLSANRPLYDSLRENHYGKPRTIRGPTPYKREKQSFYYKDRRRILTSSSSDTSEEKQSTIEGDKISLYYFETDSNFDEIKLNNENITKITEAAEEDNNQADCNANINVEEPFVNIIEIDATEQISDPHTEAHEELNKTLIEVDGPTECNEKNIENVEEFKTIVPVEAEEKDESEDKYKNDQDSSSKHSHKYLREFLETQKGSRKPLQNFLTKKFSNLSRRNSKDLTSNLADNQFHSLPDITVSKNLKKFEKIDKKLRKCEKVTSLTKKPKESESRFIVNIGKHFDITANSNIPVDFEVKIARVPKKNKLKKKKGKSEEQFLEAVKSLKDTLNCNKLDQNRDSTKPEVVGLKTKSQNTDEQEITMDLHNECVKEYKEKLGTMRNYWGKMVNGNVPGADPAEDTSDGSKCKIVDVQTKVDEVKKKFEPSEDKEPEKPGIVQVTKQLFEPKQEKPEKLSPFIKETCNYFESPNNCKETFESLNPNIVEIINRDEACEKASPGKHKPVSKSSSIAYPEFDHVRYRVVKSDLFQKKIFANCDKESQFDGLMQYLQDYSFQELLIDNNIVIIEPIRSKIPHQPSKANKNTKNITPLLHKAAHSQAEDNAGLKRHFFYHPIRVNKEVNDDELPNPDTVKQVRQFFEGGLKRSRSSQEFQAPANTTCAPKTVVVDPDKDHCSATDTNSNPSNISDFGSHENLYDSFISGQHCCEQQYVSEDILEKIRECGTTVTYYGGQVVKKQCAQPSLTKVIMEEIRNNERKMVECRCKRNKEEMDDKNKDPIYQGVRFRLVKSNSCNSRLELVGTSNLKEFAQKYIAKQKEQQHNFKNVIEIDESRTENFHINIDNSKEMDKNIVNETIKKSLENNQPKIISEERKMTQWGDTTKEKTFTSISYNDRSPQKINFDYRNYDKLKTKSKKIDDMEFEQYEVAS